MPPVVDSVSGTGQASASSTVAPSFSSFQFSTIGKEPDLLKRISAPEPNQDYQDDSTPSPSPSHSPVQITGSKLSLLQKLTNIDTNAISHTIGNAPSDLNPGTSTASAFDPVFAALFSANVRIQPRSIPAMGRRPRSPSDMDMSSTGTTPRIARSLSLTQPTPTDGAVDLITDNTRFASADLLNGLELAYPPTEGRLSASQDSLRHLSMNADTIPDQGFSTRLNNVIAYLESKFLQQSKVLTAIASLERDFQLVASQTSLALEKANQAEATADKSLSIAKNALAVAQQSVAAANVVNTGVENALTALVHLRQCYTDEHAASEQDRADLLYKMTSLKRDMESSSSQGSSCNEPPGLGSDVLRILSTEAMKLVRERDPGAKKRKRSSDETAPTNTCDLASRPSKEARHEHPILFFDKTVESEAEAAREAWVQEAERRSTAPLEPVQQTAHEQKAKEAMSHGHKDLMVEEDNHGQAARSGSTQSQLVNEDVEISSDKLGAPLVEGSEENGANENSHSEESSESKELRARWEREVAEHKLEIARFQMQERDLQGKKGKQKEAEGMAPTVSEQTEQSAPLRTRPPPTFVPATTTAANTLERNAQQAKPGLSDASRMKVVKLRLAFEKQRALPAIGQGSSLAASAAQTSVLQEALKSVADTGRSDFEETGNDRVPGKEQEQGEQGRETDNRVTGAKPRGQGTLITRGSVDAKDTSKLSVGNVTAQKTLVASAQPKTATSLQRGKTFVPQNSASTATANVPVPQNLLLHPLSPWYALATQFPQMAMGMNYGSFPLNDTLSQPLQPRDQDTRQSSLPPIECIAEPDQVESNSAIKRRPSPQKRKQGAKKAAKPRQNASNIRGMNAQPSSTKPDPHKKDAASNVPPLTLASNDDFPKPEVISPTLPPIDQRAPAQEAQASLSNSSVQPATAPPKQHEHIDNPAPMSVPQPLHDSHQVSSSSEPRSRPLETAEHELRVEPTNDLQPLPVNGQVVAAAERVSKPPSKPTPGQAGKASAFLKTPHGGHREISGNAASSKPLSRSGLVDHNVSGKAPLPTNGQQVAHDLREEVSASLHAIVTDSSFGAPAASVITPAARSSVSDNPPANVSTSLNSSQMPSSLSTGVSIRDSNPLRLAVHQVETSQQPTYPKPARLETRLFHSRSRSRSPPSSSPSPITNRKRNWNVMDGGDHWSPGQETRGRRPRTTRMLPRRSPSPIQHLPLSQRLSESTNSHAARSTSHSYWRTGDTYRPDNSSPYYEDDIDRPRDLIDRVALNTHRQDHNDFVRSKRLRYVPPHSNSREGRGGGRPLEERIS